MENIKLSKIIANYKAQCELYNQMLHLSLEQVSLLGDKEDFASRLHSLIMARKLIMDEITSLNEENKEMQEVLISELGLEEFVLNKLEGLVEEQASKELKEVISSMSTLLNQINANDKLNEALLKKNARQKSNKTTSNMEASKAYQENMKKPKLENPSENE